MKVMTSVRLPVDCAAKLDAVPRRIGQTRSSLIIDAVRAFLAPGSRAAYLENLEARRQLDDLLCELGRLAADLRRHGGLMAMAIKTSNTADKAALEDMRRVSLEVAALVSDLAAKLVKKAG
ncbi:hypothetical protein CCR94_17190 [Rhodoblastus sphagnicola]|uniref:Uncharacterized protein n=2 Tax=Rhodoblastus sphagnicola TaxID=333368 RepID=A0A2S6N202_9HYPH|nr:hypothetical protein CCR94_17190 [Rhodoblastus sphagnicola]